MSVSKGIPHSAKILQEIQEYRDELVRSTKREVLQAYRRFFSSTDGKIILDDWKRSFDDISFTPGYPDVTNFKEGRRSHYLDILKAIDLAFRLLPGTETDNPTGREE